MRRVITGIGFVCSLVMATASPRAQRPSLVPTTREVHYTSRSVVTVNARLRFTTLIILPETEEILDFVCGDKDFWIVSGAQNLAYVKPAKAGAVTNLNLVAASGHVYSFLLAEGGAEPDLKLYVTADETVSPVSNTGKRFYTGDEVAAFKRAAEDARRDIQAARVDAAKAVEERVAKYRASFPTELQFPYRFKPHQRPFDVAAIYTDGKFTYIRANA